MGLSSRSARLSNRFSRILCHSGPSTQTRMQTDDMNKLLVIYPLKPFCRRLFGWTSHNRGTLSNIGICAGNRYARNFGHDCWELSVNHFSVKTQEIKMKIMKYRPGMYVMVAQGSLHLLPLNHFCWARASIQFPGITILSIRKIFITQIDSIDVAVHHQHLVKLLYTLIV